MRRQYFLFEQAKTEDLALSLDMQELNGYVAVHTHDCTELVIILAGKAVHMINDEEYDLKAGDVFVVNLGSRHGYKAACSLKLANIMFDYNRLVENENELRHMTGFQSLFILEPYFRKQHKFESKLQLNPASLNFVKDFLSIVENEYQNRANGFKPVVRTYFLTLVAYLSRQYTAGKSKASGRLFQVADAVAFMENNFQSQVAISTVASIAYLSTRQFTRIFKASYKVSPKEYIITLRLEYACRLLQDKTMKLGPIAMECGFSDISFFSRQFKARFGITPSEYREGSNSL